MMPCFATPCFMPRRTYASCNAATPCRMSCGPCSPLLFIAFTVFILPTLLKLVFFGFGFFLLNFAPFLAVAAMTHALFRDIYTDKTQAATDKTKSSEPTNARNVHDNSWSAVRTEVEDKMIRVVLSIPGMRSADLDVRVVDGDVLRVTGETKKGADVYRVAKDVQLPRGVEMDTMNATHEDGELTVVVQRKIRRVNIPVASVVTVNSAANSETTKKPTAEEPAKEESEEEDAKEEGSQDEWEPLPTTSGRNTWGTVED